MPKKSATVRGGASRNKPKVQKNFELVRPNQTLPEQEAPTVEDVELIEAEQVEAEQDEQAVAFSESVTTEDTDTISEVVSTASTEKSADALVSPASAPKTRRRGRTTSVVATPEPTEVVDAESKETETEVETQTSPASPAPKSASARMIARRQAMQKAQQRAAASLITSEHFSYVRKDLRFIAILAVIMFIIIIALRFVPGIGF